MKLDTTKKLVVRPIHTEYSVSAKAGRPARADEQLIGNLKSPKSD